jgi:predicted hydrocarbon binding protein
MDKPRPVPRIRGQIFESRILWVRDHEGPASVQTVMEALTPEDRKAIRGLERGGWYPLSLFLRMEQAMVVTLGGGDPVLLERMGEGSARRRTEWLKEHGSLVSVHGLLARIAEEHRHFLTFGRATYQRLGFHTGEIVFSEYPEPSLQLCRSARGYLRGAVEAVAGTAAAVETTCQCQGAPACTFRLSWKVPR